VPSAINVGLTVGLRTVLAKEEFAFLPTPVMFHTNKLNLAHLGINSEITQSLAV
jgi:hypothetical protein